MNLRETGSVRATIRRIFSDNMVSKVARNGVYAHKHGVRSIRTARAMDSVATDSRYAERRRRRNVAPKGYVADQPP